MILAELLEEPRRVDAIRKLLRLRQTRVSQHLTVLRHEGLVAFKQNGACRCYYPPKPGLARAIFKLLQRDYPTVKAAEAG